LGIVGGKGEGNASMLKLYHGIVMLIVIFEFIAVILIAVFWGSINDSIREGLLKDVQTEYKGETSTDGISKSWNTMQKKWKCCGSYNYTDYIESTFGDQPPWTCCVMEDGKKGDNISDVKNLPHCQAERILPYPPNGTYKYQSLYPTGCYEGLKKFVDTNSAIIIGVICGLIGIQILGLVFSVLLMRKN